MIHDCKYFLDNEIHGLVYKLGQPTVQKMEQELEQPAP